MLQIIDYTIEELKEMITVNRNKGEKSSPLLFFDGKAVHEILTPKALCGEVFRKVKYRYDSKIILEASNFGRIKKDGLILPQHEESKTSNGYLVVDITSPYPAYVYQIVADAWLDCPKEKDMEIHHINNNGYDNRPQNLVYVLSTNHKIIHK